MLGELALHSRTGRGYKNYFRVLLFQESKNRKSWKPATCGMKKDGAREGTRTPTVYHH